MPYIEDFTKDPLHYLHNAPINVSLPFIPDKEIQMYFSIMPKTGNCVVTYFASPKAEYLTRIELQKNEPGVFIHIGGFWERLKEDEIENT